MPGWAPDEHGSDPNSLQEDWAKLWAVGRAEEDRPFRGSEHADLRQEELGEAYPPTPPSFYRGVAKLFSLWGAPNKQVG